MADEFKIERDALMELKSVVRTQREDMEKAAADVKDRYGEVSGDAVWQRVARGRFVAGGSALQALLEGNMLDFAELEQQLEHMAGSAEELDAALRDALG